MRSLPAAGGPNGAPDAFRRRRHVDVLNPERCQGVDYGVNEAGRRAHGPGFAAALYAEYIGPAGHFVPLQNEAR